MVRFLSNQKKMKGQSYLMQVKYNHLYHAIENTAIQNKGKALNIRRYYH